ncbi:MAG: ribokinase [Candidatus Actinomarinales bacterium]|mgnify:FL=1|nr:MAG: ribokinase [Candidatus Actinomarinales bacterium]
MKSKICVVGSSNIDQISYVENIPGDGETVFGSSYQMGFGGKGANQAVMASLLGAETYMITCLGEDVYADMTIENYKKNNINIDHLQIVPGSSGVAPIWVDESGQNRIIVISGSNDLIDAEKVIESLSKITDLKIIVGQFEIPLEVTEKVFSFAKENNITTILNPAPAKIPSENLLSLTDWFIPNEVEFATISNLDAFVDEDLIEYGNSISGNLIVTLGEEGAASVAEDSVNKISAPKVKAIDTTGAGDAFVGAFAYGLASDLMPQDAIKLAIDRASNSVTKPGTQISYSAK